MEKIWYAVVVIVVVSILAVMGAQISACSNVGGKLVRGLFLFECIK